MEQSLLKLVQEGHQISLGVKLADLQVKCEGVGIETILHPLK